VSAESADAAPGPPGPGAAARAPSDRTTLLEVLASYEAEGYTADFGVTEDGRIRCGVCHHEVEPEGLDLTSLRRLEGASDPDDMQAVLALACPDCGARGTAVVHYGPDAGPGETRVLLAVADERAGGPDPG
jgi:hypothetical protein